MASTVKTGSGAEAARDRLLKAAVDELVTTGELEVAAVARRAGTSAGLPYRYFGTRTGLLVAVIDDFYLRLAEAAVYRRFPGDTWRERERQRVAAWVAFLYADPIAPHVLGGLTGDAEVSQANADRLHRAVEVGARNIAQAQRTGELPADRDPRLLAAAVLGGVHTALAAALNRRPRPRRQRVAGEMWAFVAGAVGLRP